MRTTYRIIVTIYLLAGLCAPAFAADNQDAQAKTQAQQPAFKQFSDFPALDIQFNLGYIFNSVNGTFNNGLPRIGVNVYHQLHDPTATKGPDLYGNLFLTSSAEQKTKQFTVADFVNSADEKAVEATLGAFLPLATVTATHSRYGLLGEWGTKKVDGVQFMQQRYYGGLRMATNPELYFDVLGGRSEGLKSTRMEIRAQFPITKTNFLVGVIGNFAIADHQPAEADVFSTYVSLKLDLSVFFEGLTKTLVPAAK